MKRMRLARLRMKSLKRMNSMLGFTDEERARRVRGTFTVLLTSSQEHLKTTTTRDTQVLTRDCRSHDWGHESCCHYQDNWSVHIFFNYSRTATLSRRVQDAKLCRIRRRSKTIWNYLNSQSRKSIWHGPRVLCMRNERTQWVSTVSVTHSRWSDSQYVSRREKVVHLSML